MANFYAVYPPSAASSNTVQTVQGEGTPGVQTGGVLTVQGDPSGTPIPVTGTFANPSVGPTGSPVPADITYAGMNVGGTAIGLTGTANGLKVDGSAVNQPVNFTDTTATGNITSTQNVSISTTGYATVGVQVTGTWTGTLFTEWSPDNTNWYNTTWASIQNGTLSLTFTTNGAGTIQCSGAAAIRVRGSSVATGTAVVYLRANSTTAQIMLDNPIPTGSNTIGAVNQASAPWTVTGTGTAGTAASGVVTIQGIASMTPVKVDPSGGTGSVNVAQFGGSNVVTGTGTSGSGIPRVTVSSDSSLAAVTAITNPLPAGINIIGKFGIDQTTPGTTNAVQLTAGSAIIGKVSIDQTTPGTTNGVQVNAALPAGSNSIGNIGTVTTVTGVTTVSTVTAVTAITNALPAGTNLLGKTGIDQTTPGTTNGVQATSGTTAIWQAEGAIAAGSITSSFATIFTPSANTKILFMRNNTNASVSVSMDAGTTTNFVLDSGDQVAIDFIANGIVSTTTAIQIKSTGSPSTGSFRVNGCH